MSNSMQQSSIGIHDTTHSSSMFSSQSSDAEGGPVFSSSTYDDDDNDDDHLLPTRNRQTTITDDNKFDFELIHAEIGMCRPPQNGPCEVHVLGETPIQIHENHFAKPLQRNDILKAPAHLPVPKWRISVREISLNWHIYGGSDFAQPKPSKILSYHLKFFITNSPLSLDDSHQQPIQLNINDSVRYTATKSSSPAQ